MDGRVYDFTGLFAAAYSQCGQFSSGAEDRGYDG
jgi:hypothetical protein